MTNEPQKQRAWKPMTLTLASLGVLSAWTALLPENDRPWNIAALGAVGLFTAARLPLKQSLLVLLLAILVKDVSIYLTFGWKPAPLSWLAFVPYLACGRLLRHTQSLFRIGEATVVASLLFFLVSNFGSWLNQALPYGYSLEGLLNCYEAGIPFHRNTLIGDLACTSILFSLHAALSWAFFPSERVAPQTETVR